MYAFARSTTAALLCVALLATGCAVFEGNKLPKVDVSQRAVQPAAAERPNAAVKFAAFTRYASTKSAMEASRALMEQELIGELSASGYFGLVGPGDQAQVKFDVQLTDAGNPAALIPAAITGLSFYTIPSWATGTYTATVRVSTPGRPDRSYELSDTATLVQWLPMIFVAPAKGLFKVPTEIRKNIWRNLIAQMEADGTLPAVAAADGLAASP